MAEAPRRELSPEARQRIQNNDPKGGLRIDNRRVMNAVRNVVRFKGKFLAQEAQQKILAEAKSWTPQVLQQNIIDTKTQIDTLELQFKRKGPKIKKRKIAVELNGLKQRLSILERISNVPRKVMARGPESRVSDSLIERAAQRLGNAFQRNSNYDSLYRTFERHLDGIKSPSKFSLLGEFTRRYRTDPKSAEEWLNEQLVKNKKTVDLSTGPKPRPEARIETLDPKPKPEAKIEIPGQPRPSSDATIRTEEQLRREAAARENAGRGIERPKSHEDARVFVKGFGDLKFPDSPELERFKKLISEIEGAKAVTEEVKAKVLILIESITGLKAFFGDGEFEELLTKIVKMAVNNGNEYLYNRLTMRFGPQMNKIETKLGNVIDRMKQNAKAQDSFRAKMEELLAGLNANGKANQDEVKTLLNDLETRLGQHVDEAEANLARKLDTEVSKILTKLESFFEPAKFETLLTKILNDAFARERPVLVQSIVDKFKTEFPELENLKARFDKLESLIDELKKQGVKLNNDVRDDLVDIAEWLEEFKNGNFTKLDELTKKLEKFESFFETKTFEKFLQDSLLPGIREAIGEGNGALYDRLAQNIGNKFTKLRNMILKLSNEEKQRYINLKNRIDKLADLTKEEKEEILTRLWEVYTDLGNQGKANTKEIVDKIAELKDYFKTDEFKTIISDIVKSTVPELATLLIAELEKRGILTKDEAQKMLDKQTEDLKKYMDEKLKGNNPVTPTTPSTPKPGEAKSEGAWRKWLPQTAFTLGGLGLLAILIAFLVMGIMKASSQSGGASKVISITPVIGESAKTAASSGSLLGSLGGINPLIIILILVALFLLFPKK